MICRRHIDDDDQRTLLRAWRVAKLSATVAVFTLVALATTLIVRPPIESSCRMKLQDTSGVVNP
jgi:hypothetical protein